MTKLILKWSVGLVALAMLGCGGGGNSVDTAPVSGTVTLDGKPLAKAEVNFFNEKGNFLGTGVTNDQGKYTLVQGAAVGTNKVWITTQTTSAVNAAGDEGFVDLAEHPEKDPVQGEAMEGGKKKEGEKEGEKVPDKFNNPDSTVLTFNVQKGGATNANFALTSN